MVSLDGTRLTIAEVTRVANEKEEVKLTRLAWSRMQTSRQQVEESADKPEAVYALNTGVGLLAHVRLRPDQIDQMQVNLIRSHCAGVGQPLPNPVVRGMMLLRANVLAKGLSGIRPEVAQFICDLLNQDIVPVIPSRGSVGASGDLAPLAHMALVMIGEGEAAFRGERLPGSVCLARANLAPLRLKSKEGISLLNGTQAMLSLASLALVELESLFWAAQRIAAMSLEALGGTTTAFDERLHAARPHPGQILSARSLRELLEGSGLARRRQTERVQDAYCLRCIPQVHGAVWDTLCEARRIIDVELNSATDNPLVFGADIVSGGNFHGAPLALTMDYLAIAICQLAGISERRLDRLLNPAFNEGLPAFLAGTPGLESGLMMAQVTAAALLSELRVLASPASTGSIPTSGNQEDFVSMGMTSALKLTQAVELAQFVLAIEALAAVRALDFRISGDSSTHLADFRDGLRQSCPAWSRDCVLSKEIDRAAFFLKSHRWTSQVCPSREEVMQ